MSYCNRKKTIFGSIGFKLVLLRLLNFENLVNVDFSNNQLKSYRAYFLYFKLQLFRGFGKSCGLKFFLELL